MESAQKIRGRPSGWINIEPVLDRPWIHNTCVIAQIAVLKVILAQALTNKSKFIKYIITLIAIRIYSQYISRHVVSPRHHIVLFTRKA